MLDKVGREWKESGRPELTPTLRSVLGSLPLIFPKALTSLLPFRQLVYVLPSRHIFQVVKENFIFMLLVKQCELFTNI